MHPSKGTVDERISRLRLSLGALSRSEMPRRVVILVRDPRECGGDDGAGGSHSTSCGWTYAALRCARSCSDDSTSPWHAAATPSSLTTSTATTTTPALLTAVDQLDHNRFIAAEAHARGLSVGLTALPMNRLASR